MSRHPAGTGSGVPLWLIPPEILKWIRIPPVILKWIRIPGGDLDWIHVRRSKFPVYTIRLRTRRVRRGCVPRAPGVAG